MLHLIMISLSNDFRNMLDIGPTYQRIYWFTNILFLLILCLLFVHYFLFILHAISELQVVPNKGHTNNPQHTPLT